MALRRSVRYRRFRQDPDDIRERARAGPPGGGGGSTGGQYGRESTSRESGRSSRRVPLGVPDDYRSIYTRDPESFRGMSPNAVERWSEAGAGPGGVGSRGPRYFEGDQWKPGSSGRDAIINRQRALVLGGYLGTDFALGRWDEPTRNAYQMLLEEANGAGLTAEQMIQQAAMSPQMGGGGGGGSGGGGGGGGGMMIDPVTGELISVSETFVPPPLEIRTLNKADLSRVFRGATREMLGIQMSDEQISELVDAYGWMEIKMQTDAYNQEVERMRQEFEQGVSGVTGMGGAQPGQQQITTLSPPSPETFIEDKLREEHPEEVEEQAGLLTLLDMLGGWG